MTYENFRIYIRATFLKLFKKDYNEITKSNFNDLIVLMIERLPSDNFADTYFPYKYSIISYSKFEIITIELFQSKKVIPELSDFQR